MPNNPLIVKNLPVNSKLVKKSQLFASLPENLLQEMAEHFRVELWDKKTYVNPDILQHRFYLIIEGRIEMMRTNAETGRSISLDLLYPSDSFDIISLLDGQVHKVLFSPLEDLRLFSVPINKMREWIWTYPELNRQFMPYLAQKMREQENKTTDLALHDTTTRLSRIILQSLNKTNTYSGILDDEHQLINGLSDELLARLVGSVRQVVNKQLQHWKKEGAIDKKRNEIIIKDLQRIIDDADYMVGKF